MPVLFISENTFSNTTAGHISALRQASPFQVIEVPFEYGDDYMRYLTHEALGRYLHKKLGEGGSMITYNIEDHYLEVSFFIDDDKEARRYSDLETEVDSALITVDKEFDTMIETDRSFNELLYRYQVSVYLKLPGVVEENFDTSRDLLLQAAHTFLEELGTLSK
jgi:hypothetical protein